VRDPIAGIVEQSQCALVSIDYNRPDEARSCVAERELPSYTSDKRFDLEGFFKEGFAG
jgi:hypothetical protein